MGKSSRGLTRRQVIKGAGGAGLALGAISLSATKAYAEDKWDHETDILVVGAGVGGATAAVTAHENGDAVILLEKSLAVGGTSAKSAGVLWIPNNFTLKEKGIEDGRDDCLKYMARFSYPERYNPADEHLGLHTGEYELLAAYYDNASDAIDMLRAKGDLNPAEWRGFDFSRSVPDYLDNVPEHQVPFGRALGPIKPDGSLGLGPELMTQLGNAVRERGIPILTQHRAARAIIDDEGRVAGLEAQSGDKTVSIRARKGVIFATGGYVHNTEFVDAYQRNRLYGSCAMPMAEGDFINIAGAAGARMGGMSSAWRTQILLDNALQSRVLGAGVFFPAGDSAFQVNRYGVRVVNENRNYNDRTEVHGIYDASKAEFPNQLMFMVYDQRTAEAFAGAYPLPAEPAGASYVLNGETLEALTDQIAVRLKEVAEHTGGFSLDSSFTENLKATIKRFNGFARSGKDEDFQRGDAAYDNEWHRVFSPMRADTEWPANEGPTRTMHPFRDEGPYYAIIFAAGALDTSGGPAIDANARVLDTKDRPIPGLYGAGNCIASPSGEAYWGAGHTLGLSMTFGYIAANAAHKA
jgi:succinate dehydrogenase/fumarate reductase flavoprotein subunit